MLEYIDRRGSDCYKWDSEQAQGTLPLWIADMDFAAAKPIREAMRRRLEHGVFGYSIVPQANYDAVAHWFERRHGWKGINRDNLLYTTAVVPAISAVFKALELLRTSDSQPLRVLTFTPAYNCFFSCIENMGCELVPSPLVLQNNRFEINWSDLEAKAQQADVFLLCNPHNPTGRVWSREELERMADIMRREHLFVLSDEIHCEFAFKVAYDEKDSIGKRYRRQDAVGTPFCITVDHDTEKDGCVTVRYRDTMLQDRVKIEDLHEIIRKATDPKELYRKIVGDSMEDTME